MHQWANSSFDRDGSEPNPGKGIELYRMMRITPPLHRTMVPVPEEILALKPEWDEGEGDYEEE